MLSESGLKITQLHEKLNYGGKTTKQWLPLRDIDGI